MRSRLVRVEIPDRIVMTNGWYLNPRRPVEVWDCPEHGEWTKQPWAPRCHRCQSAAQRRAARRRPPGPPFRNQQGCNLCGRWPLPGQRRSWCSDECVLLWNAAVDPRLLIRQLTTLHGGRCWVCDHDLEHEGEIEVDHIRPLWSLTEDLRGDLRWWLPFNLQILCIACHRAKTKWEAGHRAAVRAGRTDWRPWSPDPGAQLTLL